MYYPELERITDFDTTHDRLTELHHFIRHACRDLVGLTTPDDYLHLAQSLGKLAAQPDPQAGTYVHPRGQEGELAVFVQDDLTRQHTAQPGIFMVVRSRDYGPGHGPPYCLLVTIYGAKKKVFDDDRRIALH